MGNARVFCGVGNLPRAQGGVLCQAARCQPPGSEQQCKRRWDTAGGTNWGTGSVVASSKSCILGLCCVVCRTRGPGRGARSARSAVLSRIIQICRVSSTSTTAPPNRKLARTVSDAEFELSSWGPFEGWSSQPSESSPCFFKRTENMSTCRTALAPLFCHTLTSAACVDVCIRPDGPSNLSD